MPGARFFAALDRKLRVERLRLDELLGSYDRDGNAGLDEQELGRLARSLLNEDLTAQSIKYLMVGSCAYYRNGALYTRGAHVICRYKESAGAAH